MKLTDFEMACPSDAPQRQVNSFFGSNGAYLRLEARRPADPLDGEFEVESLAALLTDPTIRDADDRRVAIELQLDFPVPFVYPQVRAIIMPDQFKTAIYVDAYLNGPGRGVVPVFYPMSPMKRALDYQVPIEEFAIRLQQSWGWL